MQGLLLKFDKIDKNTINLFISRKSPGKCYPSQNLVLIFIVLAMSCARYGNMLLIKLTDRS